MIGLLEFGPVFLLALPAGQLVDRVSRRLVLGISTVLLIAIAGSDDAKQPDAKDKLRKAFNDANVTATVEVLADKHGWCVPDMPQEDGAPIYNQADAERAWSELLALYKGALA